MRLTLPCQKQVVIRRAHWSLWIRIRLACLCQRRPVLLQQSARHSRGRATHRQSLRAIHAELHPPQLREGHSLEGLQLLLLRIILEGLPLALALLVRLALRNRLARAVTAPLALDEHRVLVLSLLLQIGARELAALLLGVEGERRQLGFAQSDALRESAQLSAGLMVLLLVLLVLVPVLVLLGLGRGLDLLHGLLAELLDELARHRVVASVGPLAPCPLYGREASGW
jgi:hypothetical protein